MSREDEMETTAAIDREMRGHAADVEKALARLALPYAAGGACGMSARPSASHVAASW